MLSQLCLHTCQRSCWGGMRTGAMLAIAFVHNLLRRHPACNVLLHRPSPKVPTEAAESPEEANSTVAEAEPESLADECAGEEADADVANPKQHRRALEDPAAPGLDPYLPEEEDPAESRAIDSSLWEMDTLRQHYCPQVSLQNGYLHPPGCKQDVSDPVKSPGIPAHAMRRAWAPGRLGPPSHCR